MTRPPPRSPLFPYTTLFRSHTSELQSHSHLVCRLLQFRRVRSEEHTSELQSHSHLVCRLLLEKKNRFTRRGHLARAAASCGDTQATIDDDPPTWALLVRICTRGGHLARAVASCSFF